MRSNHVRPPHQAPRDATCQQLLESAAGVFAEAGFRAATVREICLRAGANIAAVNYHFGDKETLYRQALQHALRCAREKYPPTLGLSRKASPAERLKAFVLSFLLRIFDQGRHAWHGKLMLREMVEPTQALDDLVAAEIRPMSRRLRSIVRGVLGARASEERVRLCSMSVVSQVLFYHHCRPVTVRLHPKMKFDPISLERLAEHITQFSLAAMKEFRNRPPTIAKNAI